MHSGFTASLDLNCIAIRATLHRILRMSAL
jgi:hypothetical protein